MSSASIKPQPPLSSLGASSDDIAPSIKSAKAAGLWYVSDATPGIRRKRAGKGFSYIGRDGKPIHEQEELRRIRALAIPGVGLVGPDKRCYASREGNVRRRTEQCLSLCRDELITIGTIRVPSRKRHTYEHSGQNEQEKRYRRWRGCKRATRCDYRGWFWRAARGAGAA